MDKIIFTQPVIFQRIWGGDKILKYIGQDIKTSEAIGEAWGISGHKSGDTIILSGIHKGKKISEAIAGDLSILGEQLSELPIQIRILDSKDDLSVQVHPDNIYGRKHSNDNGKNECWYILDCEKNASLVYGHNMLTKEELTYAIRENKIMDKLNYLPIKQGDLVYVPTGLVHAMTKNITAIEISDQSDVTYRVFDYNRTDASGNKRELHVENAMNVIETPCKYPVMEQQTIIGTGFIKEILLDKNDFYIANLKVNGIYKEEKNHPYYACFVIEGSGTISSTKIKKGDFFILTSQEKEIMIEGNVEILFSHLKSKGGTR